MTSDLYAVVGHRQWSGPSDSNVMFRDSLAEAVELADELTAGDATAPRPRTFHVYRMELVEEDED